MTVGEYAGVPLQDSGDTWRNGAVFLLRKAARKTASVSLDGWVTSVVRGATVVITCGPSAASGWDETFAAALIAANGGLDYMSVTGVADCAIRDARDDCLVWWPDPVGHGTVMRSRMITTYGFTISLTGTVTDAAGNVVPSPPPPTPMVHDAYRFIRMCRTSDDLYDSYRNLFLAFECLLSDIRPPRRIVPRRRWWCLRRGTPHSKWEGETQWFMEALSEADKLVPLATLTPPNVQNHRRWIRKHIYDRERSALMHAKSNRGRDYLLPQDDLHRAELIASLGKLWRYISELVKAHLGVTHPASYWSDAALQRMAEAVFREHAVVISDDEGAVNPQAQNSIGEGSTLVELQPDTPAVDPDEPRLWTVLAHCDATDLNTLTAVRKLGLQPNSGEAPVQVISELVGPLYLGSSVVRFEVVFGMREVNPTDAPKQFSS
jgi:hypothetical protein